MNVLVSRLFVAVAVASSLYHVAESVRVGEEDVDVVATRSLQDPGKAGRQDPPPKVVTPAPEPTGDKDKKTDRKPKASKDDEDDDEDDRKKAKLKPKPAPEADKEGDKKPEKEEEKKEEKKKQADACTGHGTAEELYGWFKRARRMLPKKDEVPASKEDPSEPDKDSECMANRQRKTIDEMADKNCHMILEVKGYLKPIIDSFQPDKPKDDGKGGPVKVPEMKDTPPPALYLNVDESMENASIEARGPTCIIHLPMSLTDFMGSKAKTLREQFNISLARDALPGPTCAVMLGLSARQLKTKRDKVAVAGLFHNSTFGAAEAAEDEVTKVFEDLTTLAKSAGHMPYKDDQVDCLDSMRGKGSKFTAVREMRFFKAEAANKGKGKEEVKKELDKKEKDSKPEKDPSPATENNMEKYCKFRNGKNGKKRKQTGDNLDCAPIMSCEWKPDPSESAGGVCIPGTPQKKEEKQQQPPKPPEPWT